jgi:hypothetical protein
VIHTVNTHNSPGAIYKEICPVVHDNIHFSFLPFFNEMVSVCLDIHFLMVMFTLSNPYGPKHWELSFFNLLFRTVSSYRRTLSPILNIASLVFLRYSGLKGAQA